MKILYWKNNKLKFLKLTLLKIKFKDNATYLMFCSIPIFKFKKNGGLIHILSDFKQNKDFDVRSFDKRISMLIQYKQKDKFCCKVQRIGYIITSCGDMGGHTKCIKSLVNSLNGLYEQKLFFSQYSFCKNSAPNFLAEIKHIAGITGLDASLYGFKKQLEEFVDKIINFSPKALMVYIDPNDIFCTAVLAYLKKTTNIKIIFANHASHYPNLGMTFADVILEGMPATVKITNEKRHLYNTIITGLQSLPKDKTIYYSKDELNNLKKEIGIDEKSLITMSGGSSYKFFEKDMSSEYFEMIKRILLAKKSLTHVIISELNSKQTAIVDDIFKDAKDIKRRLLFLPYQTNFDKYFQMADVFIDSFPISSALTQIDLMRNKVASVVKINKQTPEYSFHEYQMPDYPYMFERVEDIENAVLELLGDEAKRNEIISNNYDFWLKTYESSVYRDRIIKIIEEENFK